MFITTSFRTSQKLRKTEMSIIYEQTMIYLYGITLFNSKATETIARGYNLDESQNNYGKWKKPARTSAYSVLLLWADSLCMLSILPDSCETTHWHSWKYRKQIYYLQIGRKRQQRPRIQCEPVPQIWEGCILSRWSLNCVCPTCIADAGP